MDSSDNKGDFNPQQEEVLPVPTSGVTSSSDTYWQIWKDSSLLKVPEARSSFQSDHQLIRGNPYILHALFHFFKNTHLFPLFSNKKSDQTTTTEVFKYLLHPEKYPKIPRILSKVATIFFYGLNRAALIHFLRGTLIIMWSCLKTNLEIYGFCGLPN